MQRASTYGARNAVFHALSQMGPMILAELGRITGLPNLKMTICKYLDEYVMNA